MELTSHVAIVQRCPSAISWLRDRTFVCPSPVWVRWNKDKQWYVPMASRESTAGRKLKDIGFLCCTFACCCHTSLPKSWVSPPLFWWHPYASPGLQPSIFDYLGLRERGKATSLPSVPSEAPRYLTRRFGFRVKIGHFGFAGHFVGGSSPAYRGVRTKCWARSPPPPWGALNWGAGEWGPAPL